MTLCCVLIKVPVSLFQKYIIDLQAEYLLEKAFQRNKYLYMP